VEGRAVEDRIVEAKKDLIRQLDEARAQLLAALANLDTKTEIYPRGS